MGLVAKPKTILQLIQESLINREDSQDWLSMTPPTEEKSVSITPRMLEYLEILELDADTCIIKEGDEINGMYFIEEGQFTSKITSSKYDGTQEITLKAGTMFGEIGYYTKQRSLVTLTSDCPGKLFYLSGDNFHRMEAEDPELAIAFHRVVAGNIGEKLSHSSDTVWALRN